MMDIKLDVNTTYEEWKQQCDKTEILNLIDLLQEIIDDEDEWIDD